MIEVLEQRLLCHATDELVSEQGVRPRPAKTKKLFDAYLMVDWSASSRPKTGRDSIWYCLVENRAISTLANPSTRSAAVTEIETTLLQLVNKGRSVLVGFDFPYAYPAGFSAALGLGGDVAPWRAIWQEWKRLFADDDKNRNERFGLAAELNRRLSSNRGPGPFWGCPASQKAGSDLSAKKPKNTGFKERRLTEERARTTQPVWKLCYPGSVGSQALLGIPRVEQLRSHPKLAPVSRVWPFEWDESTEQALLDRRMQVLHAEIYPSLIEVDPAPGEVKDEVQVRELAQFFAQKDSDGMLSDLLAQPLRLAGEERRAVLREEGWILGVAIDNSAG